VFRIAILPVADIAATDPANSDVLFSYYWSFCFIPVIVENIGKKQFLRLFYQFLLI
jgi:hypothetical protein